MTYLQGLIDAIAQTHGVEARHIETVPIREMWQEKVAWEGDVEVFEVKHSAGATRCYGWGYPTDNDPIRYQYVCVLGIGPVTSPLNAVRAAIRSRV
jgi:flavin-dependent dehydrogenase